MRPDVYPIEQIINSYYSNLVNIVYSFGGDIIKIAGDALYCIFMPDERDLRGAVLCAALCSMQLREVSVIRYVRFFYFYRTYGCLARYFEAHVPHGLMRCHFIFSRTTEKRQPYSRQCSSTIAVQPQ